MFYTALVRVAFPVLDIVGPQAPPPPPPLPPAPIVIVVAADDRPVAVPGQITTGPVPCDQILADGSVYCGTPGSEPNPEENPAKGITSDGAVTIPDGHGFSVVTDVGSLASLVSTPETTEYQGGLEAMYCEALPFRCGL